MPLQERALRNCFMAAVVVAEKDDRFGLEKYDTFMSVANRLRRKVEMAKSHTSNQVPYSRTKYSRAVKLPA